MHVKKVLAVLLALALAVSLCGCGEKKDSGSDPHKAESYSDATAKLDEYIAEADAPAEQTEAYYAGLADKFSSVAAVFEELGEYVPDQAAEKSSTRAQKARFYQSSCLNNAGGLAENDEKKLDYFVKASLISLELGSYGLGPTKKASKIYKNACEQCALIFEKNEDYETAAGYYQQAGKNDDSRRCVYVYGCRLFEAGEYDLAYENLESIRTYVDENGRIVKNWLSTDEKLISAREKKYSVGNIIEFGSLEQDNNVYDGVEPIEWIILSREGDNLLMMAYKVLECKQYNKTWTATNWEQSSVRLYLNSEFLNGFTGEEKSMLLTEMTGVDIGVNDKVFLFSAEEAVKYCGEYIRGGVTKLGTAMGVWTDDSGNAWWWLRDCRNDSAQLVRSDGSVETDGYFVNYGHAGIRPVIRISISE